MARFTRRGRSPERKELPGLEAVLKAREHDRRGFLSGTALPLALSRVLGRAPSFATELETSVKSSSDETVGARVAAGGGAGRRDSGRTWKHDCVAQASLLNGEKRKKRPHLGSGPTRLFVGGTWLYRDWWPQLGTAQTLGSARPSFFPFLSRIRPPG